MKQKKIIEYISTQHTTNRGVHFIFNIDCLQLMNKIDKQEQFEQENSLQLKSKREIKIKIIRKKTKLRQITHYFAPAEKIININKNIPTPDKAAFEELDAKYTRLLEDEHKLTVELQQLKLRKQRQKEEADIYLGKNRALIASKLRSIYQIDRFIKNQQYQKIIFQDISLQILEKIIQEKQGKLNRTYVNPAVRFFLIKQLQREQAQFNKMKFHIQLDREKQKINQEEEKCYFNRQNWPLLSKKYQILQLIDKGGFSEVYRAYNIESNIIVAIKLSSVEDLLQHTSNRQEYLKCIKREYEIHMGLSHPNIVQLIQVIQLESAICLVLEYCEGMILSNYLRYYGKIQEREARIIIKQILLAIVYLNSQQPAIIHYDLKPQNIVFKEGTIKIFDFGICKTIDSGQSKIELTTQGAGTYRYLPPQTFIHCNPMISNKVDIWSLGVIFYQMIFGKQPDTCNGTQEIFLNQKIDVNWDIQIQSGVCISNLAKDFIQKCLRLNQNMRLDPFSAINHPYFNYESELNY